MENDAFGCSITINKDVVTQTEVQISNTEADYDGQPHGVDVSLNYDVAYEVLYNGTKDVPVNAGAYNVEVTGYGRRLHRYGDGDYDDKSGPCGSPRAGCEKRRGRDRSGIELCDRGDAV